ncbi:hypothetical protein EII29_04815 [Leptotrichia sp. OH3620_COT-345]|uniref:hypothetical protein n=1 Tax=Leptotrichia sp. OH3620_COT-345 TaxID=2491048 RepID=UPI000F647217|nr:hypothetical protein [Leptotrichia sp. OH3620_COT-345]RRD39847.1 hypothetical protein EII29_04815 [Leptotrichia sp. OH3620_COT-345]
MKDIIKFKEMEIFVFILKPKLMLTEYYFYSQNLHEITGFLNFMNDRKYKNNYYLYTETVFTVNGKEIKTKIVDEDYEDKMIIDARGHLVNLNTVIDRINRFNFRKIRKNKFSKIFIMEQMDKYE